MNDSELDQLLNTWTAPPAPASLLKSVRAGFAVKRKRSTGVLMRWIKALAPSARKRLVAGAILGVVPFLVIVTQAFPQIRNLISSPFRIPYTVESEFVRYADDGSSSVEMYTTSYNHNGRELVLSTSIPAHPFATAIRRTLNETGLILFQLTVPFRAKAEQAERATTIARVNKGCVDGPVVARETILTYPTIAVESRLGAEQRETVWWAPGLGCFALKLTIEEKRPDGTFRLVSEKQAVRVSLNP